MQGSGKITLKSYSSDLCDLAAFLDQEFMLWAQFPADLDRNSFECVFLVAVCGVFALDCMQCVCVCSRRNVLARVVAFQKLHVFTD